MVSGTVEKKDALAAAQPSLMRVFQTVDIPRLTNEEVRDFFIRAFDEAGMKIEEDALGLMVTYSSGLPILMQEIGDSVFWKSSGSAVRKQDAMGGLVLAAENVGTKYLDPAFYRAVRSTRYRSIVRKMIPAVSPSEFTRSEVMRRLDENESRVFDNLLRRLRELGIVEQDLEAGRGAYRFVNELYPLYMFLESAGSRTTDGSTR